MHLLRLVRRAALVLLAGALATPPRLAAQSRADLAPSPEVKSVEFRGVSDKTFLPDLTLNVFTEPTRCRSVVLALLCRFTRYRGFQERHYLNRPELRRDVLRIRVWYYKHGFREAQVDTSVTRLNEKQVAVVFDIAEGLPTVVTDVSVLYDSTLLTPKKVGELTLLQKGEPLDLFQLDSSRVFFQNELWELGHADALVDTSSVVDPVARTARVQFRLVPNHVTTVGQIVISGTDKVAPVTVLNTLGFRVGDLYKRSAVLESQRNLYESNLFKLAAIEVPETFDSAKSVNILLREAPMREARLSGGFNTVDFIQTEARFTHHNLLGGARRLELSATAGNLLASSLNGRGLFKRVLEDTTITGDARAFVQPTWQASLTLTQPAFLQRPRNALSVGAFAQRRAVPAVVIDRGYGGNVSFTRSLGFRAPASLGYRFEITRVEANGPYFCVNFGVCDTTTIGALRSHQRLSPATAQVQVDRSDTPLNPTRGYTARAELEHASGLTASDYRYNRAYADGALYARLGGKRSVLATHLRIGFVRPMINAFGDAVLHPRKRFYAGGSQSVRGFGENQLGPRILTLPHGYLLNATRPDGTPCDANTTNVRFCDPNTARDSVNATVGIGDDKFTPRPLGGTSLLEGSVEYRFPLPFLSLQGAAFVDGAAVGERILDPLGGVSTLANLVRGTAAITPGFGVRYLSSVGPIRVDVGFNPSKAENLAVVTEIMQNGRLVIIPLDTPRRYGTTGTSAGGIRGALNRFVLHLSIGQAY